MKSKKAQASLEFLIVLVAFFSLLLLFTPTITKLHYTGLLALEKKKAETFAVSLQQTLKEFSLLANGSKKSLAVKASIPWEISLTGNHLQLELHSRELNKTAALNYSLAFPVNSLQVTCTKECVFEIEKQHNTIQLTITQH